MKAITIIALLALIALTSCERAYKVRVRHTKDGTKSVMYISPDYRIGDTISDWTMPAEILEILDSNARVSAI